MCWQTAQKSQWIWFEFLMYLKKGSWNQKQQNTYISYCYSVANAKTEILVTQTF